MPALGPLLGTGRVAEVYAFGERALKLYRAGIGKTVAFREAAILAMVEQLSLPAPAVYGVVEHEGRWGVLMDRVSGPPLAEAAERDPAGLPVLITAMAALHARIHAHSGAGLPRLADRLSGAIGRAPGLMDAERESLLARAASAPYDDRLCHGDFHPYNVLGPAAAPVVVDWPDAHEGSPAADICRSYLLLRPVRPELAEMVLDAGAAAEGLSRRDVLWWLPLLAAARLAEGVPESAVLLRTVRQDALYE